MHTPVMGAMAILKEIEVCEWGLRRIEVVVGVIERVEEEARWESSGMRLWMLCSGSWVPIAA